MKTPQETTAWDGLLQRLRNAGPFTLACSGGGDSRFLAHAARLAARTASVALRRVDLSGKGDPFADILEHLDASRYLLLPNTSGVAVTSRRAATSFAEQTIPPIPAISARRLSATVRSVSRSGPKTLSASWARTPDSIRSYLDRDPEEEPFAVQIFAAEPEDFTGLSVESGDVPVAVDGDIPALDIVVNGEVCFRHDAASAGMDRWVCCLGTFPS